MNKAQNLTGRKFSLLLVISRSGSDAQGNATWNCICDCGRLCITRGYEMVRGHAKSCGCLRVPHGHHTNGKMSPTYQSWVAMHSRCGNQNEQNFYLYGGLGVSVCERWRKFESFLSDMGERPAGKSLDRYPNRQGNYEPGNCRWATPKEQSRNTKTNALVEFNGETICLAELAERNRMSPKTLFNRLRR
jgi:hypothetical protein